MDVRTNHPVKSVEQTLAILDVLKEHRSMGVTDIADEVAVGKSAVHNHLSTLAAHGLVKQAEDGTYELGLGLLDYGGMARKRLKLYRIGRSEVNAIAEETGELVNLSVKEDSECICLYRARGARAIEVDLYTGTRLALHNTAMGKSILAFLPDGERELLLDQHVLHSDTPNTITDRAALQEELDTIRNRGVAFDHEERLEGVSCVAAPVRPENEGVVGSVSITGPSNRIQAEEHRSTLVDAILNGASMVELNTEYK